MYFNQMPIWKKIVLTAILLAAHYYIWNRDNWKHK